jgi:MFS family permease
VHTPGDAMSDQEQRDAAPAAPAGSPAGDVAHLAHHKPAFGWGYWMLNSIEMFERLAYFGIRAVVPLYIMQATEPGGLHLSAMHKGWIYAWWAVFQSLLPIVTGGIADRYGYKRVLFFAISANAVGYIMMANLHFYEGFFAGILVLATGTAFFKPALQGSIAQNLTKANSSLGWGIFYWVVNVGAFAAPFISTIILGKPHSREGWDNLFYACAIFTGINLLLLLTFKDVPSGADKSESIMSVLGRTIANVWPYWFVGGRAHPVRTTLGAMLATVGLIILVFGDTTLLRPYLASAGSLLAWASAAALVIGTILATWLRGGTFTWQLRLPAWLLIMSCFWLMMYQLWDLHPNFITDWVDSSMIAAHVPFDQWWEFGDRSIIQVPQQILMNLNAGLIIFLIVPLSWAARKMRTLSAMMVGMTIATLGVFVAGFTMNGWILLLGIAFFSLGEMWTGPKKNEYLGLIAPPGKKGLYLGYVNIPVGVGVGIGSYLGGYVYDNYGEKATLALKQLGTQPALVARGAQASDWSDSLDKVQSLIDIEREAVFGAVQAHLDTDGPATTDTLLRAFRFDEGQIINLGLIYLAQHEAFRETVNDELAQYLRQRAEIFRQTAAELDERGDGESAALAAHAASFRALADRIDANQSSPEVDVLARYVHELPEWTGKSRVEVFEVVRELMNARRDEDQHLAESEVIAVLWDQYSDSADVLINLGLEYLAQETGRLRQRVAEIAAGGFEDPAEEIPERVGIGRTKAFAALSRARGAEVERVLEALAAMDAPGLPPEERLFVYLIQQHHLRYNAVARRNWSRDVPFLRAMIEGDEAAEAVVEARIDEQSAFEAAWEATLSLFGGDAGERDLYDRLADKPRVIQAALDAKDWTRNPTHAAQLLAINPYEARAMMAAEVNNAALSTTVMLWKAYQPWFGVWTPFVAIGIVATIALGIFGQMAKRWKDMNA